MNELVNISLSDAAVTALLGYLVVFIGLILLMLVITILGRIFTSAAKKTVAASETPQSPPVSQAPGAPGTAGELKLYDTEPRDAAMIMAIVANTVDKPLNQLRFISIKEVK